MIPDPKILAVVGLRAAALALGLAGQASASRTLNSVADGVEAGTAIDAHMQLVADKLKAGASTDADWADVDARIAAASQAVRDA